MTLQIPNSLSHLNNLLNLDENAGLLNYDGGTLSIRFIDINRNCMAAVIGDDNFIRLLPHDSAIYMASTQRVLLTDVIAMQLLTIVVPHLSHVNIITIIL